MANENMAKVNACLCSILAILWMIMIFSHVTWFSAKLSVVSYEVSLLSVYVGGGVVGLIASMGASIVSSTATEWIKAHTQTTVSIYEWTENVCAWSPNNWCSNWTMASHGSLFMVIFGCLTAVFLIAGGSFTYYYSHVHATHTGRIATRACLIVAPALAVIGLLVYLLTTWWADLSSQLFQTQTGRYNVGFFLAWTLAVFTLLPLYIHVTFSKVDSLEKNGDNEAFAAESGPYGTGYGADQYGAAQYGAAQGSLPPAPPMGYGYGATYTYSTGPAPAQMGPAAGQMPVPGSGVPAW